MSRKIFHLRIRLLLLRAYNSAKDYHIIVRVPTFMEIAQFVSKLSLLNRNSNYEYVCIRNYHIADSLFSKLKVYPVYTILITNDNPKNFHIRRQK